MRERWRHGTHLPYLMELIQKTSGTVIECGSGQYSTPYLHWACFPNRRLITYETDPAFYERFKVYETDWHKVVLIPNWKIVEKPCAVILIDNAPAEDRPPLIEEFKDSADYLVVHDTERNPVTLPFTYEKTYKDVKPWTTVLSNRMPL